ncbi:MAG: heavy-metal-associated domain-containing protein [Actinomycetales bacterium]|nr:heavy-metal-associated domain-containing protein [Actinomycetales bacterium]
MTTATTTTLTARFTTEPFTCPSCIKKIQSAVGRLPGVEWVKVKFNSARVDVGFDPEQITTEEIRETITGLGYPVLRARVAR